MAAIHILTQSFDKSCRGFFFHYLRKSVTVQAASQELYLQWVLIQGFRSKKLLLKDLELECGEALKDRSMKTRGLYHDYNGQTTGRMHTVVST